MRKDNPQRWDELRYIFSDIMEADELISDELLTAIISIAIAGCQFPEVKHRVRLAGALLEQHRKGTSIDEDIEVPDLDSNTVQ